MRINKFLSAAGYCSRRQSDELIKQGQVFINGQRAKLGDQVLAKDTVKVFGKLVKPANSKKDYLAYHKPVGVICTNDPKSPDNIISAINYPIRIYPVGRLDVHSSGLIFLTNDGDWAYRLTHPKFERTKEYEVTVASVSGGDKSITDTFINGLRQGVKLEEGLAKADQVTRVRNNKLRIAIHQGWNRQIRRMIESCGYQVSSLKRTAIGSVKLGSLKPGQWRALNQKEVESFTKKRRQTSGFAC